MNPLKRALLALLAALAAGSGAAQAAAGLLVLPAPPGSGPVTVFYPSDAPAQTVRRMGHDFPLAEGGAPAPGNGRLVVISHGSGGTVWPHADLAQALVAAGFTVAVPEHAGDHFGDTRQVGPLSWEQRPKEVSQAIDAVAADARLAPLRLDAGRVGVFGMSAGGITALTLAGARWSPARLAQHCQAHIADDFAGCVGLVSELTGGVLDDVKMAVARWVIRLKLGGDTRWRQWDEPRVAAVVAAVPVATPIDLASLAPPRVPLALVRAGQDAWLAPRYHVDAVRAACQAARRPDGQPGCELLADLAQGGHGSLMSPMPPGLPARAARLIDDPPGFDRAGTLPGVYAAIVRYFQQQLGATTPRLPA